MVYVNIAAAQAALSNPATSASDLMSIAQTFPSLWAAVARHPNAYPDLLTWLDQVGGDDVHQAIDSRNFVGGLPPVPVPPAFAENATSGTKHSGPRRLRNLWLIIAAVVLVIAIVTAVALVTQRSNQGVQPVVTQDNLMSVVTHMNVTPDNTNTLDCVSDGVIVSLNLVDDNSYWGVIFLTEFPADDSLATQALTCWDSQWDWTRESVKNTESGGIRMAQYKGSIKSDNRFSGYNSYSAVYGNVIISTAWDPGSTTSWSQWQNWVKKTFKPAVNSAS